MNESPKELIMLYVKHIVIARIREVVIPPTGTPHHYKYVDNLKQISISFEGSSDSFMFPENNVIANLHVNVG